MPESFFRTRPELAGVHENGYAALCTSQPAVREWMADALAHVFSEVPALAGVFTISASENLTNCASHFAQSKCPRCRLRSDADIYVEVNATMEAGIHRTSPQAKVLVSDWGWRQHGDATDIIARLPKSTWFMTVSEWAKPIERGGIKTTVGEYSVSAVGPGPRALRHWAAAERPVSRLFRTFSLTTAANWPRLPYLPVMNLVAEHLHNLAPIRLDGMIIGWTQGGYPSPTFRPGSQDWPIRRCGRGHARWMNWRENGMVPAAAPHARTAWTHMSEAFREYPFAVPVIYTSPVQLGPANPLYATGTGYRATMWGFPYDDLDKWRGHIRRKFSLRSLKRWQRGGVTAWRRLTIAVGKAPRRTACVRPKRTTHGALCRNHFSVGRQPSSVLILARDTLARKPSTVSEEQRDKLRAEMKRRLESEIMLARQLFSMVREDSCIGFEPATQYFYLPLDLVEKVINCRWLLARLDGKRPRKQV